MKVRASYREAVAWIAVNDEPGLTDPDEIAAQISVLLIADLWRKEPEVVARAVIAQRKREGMA